MNCQYLVVKMIFILFVIVCVCACLPVCLLSVCQCLQRPEEGAGFSGDGVIDAFLSLGVDAQY